jgi:protein-L-isoaspartate(D-aspartate) O-methyltransferase
MTGLRLFFWLQPGRQRVERQRIGVGNGFFLLDQHPEHAGLEQRQRRQLRHVAAIVTQRPARIGQRLSGRPRPPKRGSMRGDRFAVRRSCDEPQESGNERRAAGARPIVTIAPAALPGQSRPPLHNVDRDRTMTIEQTSLSESSEASASTPSLVEQARQNMIQQQIRPWEVLDPSVLELLARVPRERFVPPHLRSLAFVDFELPLNIDGVVTGETMLAPKVEARLLQELRIHPHELVLEIGTGSGYMAALAAHKAQTVWSVEIDPKAAGLRRRQPGPRRGAQRACRRRRRRARLGAHAPYDVIIVSGGLPMVPAELLAQLKVGGRLAAIVGQAPAMQAQIITRTTQEHFETLPLFETVTKPLRNAQGPSAFRF